MQSTNVSLPKIPATARDSQEQADAQPEWAYPALVASWALRRIEREIELADSMLIDLDRLAHLR